MRMKLAQTKALKQTLNPVYAFIASGCWAFVVAWLFVFVRQTLTNFVPPPQKLHFHCRFDSFVVTVHLTEDIIGLLERPLTRAGAGKASEPTTPTAGTATATEEQHSASNSPGARKSLAWRLSVPIRRSSDAAAAAEAKQKQKLAEEAKQKAEAAKLRQQAIAETAVLRFSWFDKDFLQVCTSCVVLGVPRVVVVVHDRTIVCGMVMF